MKPKLSIILVILFFTACQNDPILEENETELQDNIFYSDIVDSNELRSVRSFNYKPLNPNCNDVPIPKDSLADYYLDIGADLVNDYRIIVQHGDFYNVTSNHCVPYSYFIEVAGLNGSKIAMKSEYSIIIKQMDSLQLISDSLLWKENGYLQRLGDGPGLLGEISELNKNYIALKFKNNFAWLKFEKIENYGIRLLGYAFNKKGKSAIRAGQKE
jgi:hypothetical protein